MQVLLNGVISGLLISLLALAFSIVYLPTKIFGVALGGIYVLAPFMAWSCIQRSLSVPASIAIAILAGCAASLACEWGNHKWLSLRSAPSLTHLVSSLGIYTIIVQLCSMAWGTETKVLRVGLDHVNRFGGLVMTDAQLIAGVVAMAMLLGFLLALRYTSYGLVLRAMATNPREVELRGWNVWAFRTLVFALAGCLASSSALLLSLDLGFNTQGGMSALLLAVVAVIIGSQEDFVGPILGAFLLGVTREAVVWQFSSKWQDAATFALLVLILLVKPKGLLSRAARVEQAL